MRSGFDPNWRQVSVPLPVQAALPDLRDYAGSVEYRKAVTVPAHWTGGVWILFGAVDYGARVVVNDRFVGYHEGGYTPFAYDLSDIVRSGETAEISVLVEDASPSRDYSGIKFAEIPHGKQSWYGNCSGIWQSVLLEERARTHVAYVKIDADPSAKVADVAVRLSRTPQQGEGKLAAVVYASGSSTPLAQTRLSLSASLDYRFRLSVPQARAWSPDDPRIYELRLSVVSDQGAEADQFVERFGFRSIEARQGKIWLNGKPLFLAGALDQDFYPLTHYSPPSRQYLIDQFTKAKSMGLNLLRCHIKLPDPMYLEVADEVGMLVWYELPSVKKLTNASRARLAETLADITIRDYNHPSLVIVSLMNESWGIDLDVPEQRKWLISAYDQAKKLNPNRLIVDNSPCHGNFHLKTDINDFHAYHSVPDHARKYADWVADYAASPSWTFSPHGDAQRRGDEPLLLSEFGNWALPNLTLLKDCLGEDAPWWFDSRKPPVQPRGVERRFSDYGLDLVYGDFSRLARASAEAQFIALKFQVEELRKHPAISGFVVTELTDLQWESNGLMDFCRNVKPGARALQYVSKQHCVFLRPDRFDLRSDQQFRADVYASDYGGEPTSGTLYWSLEGFPDVRGSVDLAEVPAGAGKVASIDFTVPEVNVARQAHLMLRWEVNDKVVATNVDDLALYPAALQRQSLSVAVQESLEVQSTGLARWVGEAYQAASSTLDADVVIAEDLSPDLMAYLSGGGRVILLPRKAGSLPPPLGNLRVADRSEKSRWGDWASSHIWLGSSAAFSGMPTRYRVADWSMAPMNPKLVIDGIDAAGRWSDVSSGLFLGWVDHGAGLIVRCGNDRSRLLICTFDIAGAVPGSPAAEQLLRNLISVISAERFAVENEVEFAPEPKPPVQ